jgi:hypothetical protein
VVITRVRSLTLSAVAISLLAFWLAGCADLGRGTDGAVPAGPDAGVRLGTVSLYYDLEAGRGTAEFVPDPALARANVDQLTGIGFTWGKSVYDKRRTIPTLGGAGPAAILSLAVSNTGAFTLLGPRLVLATSTAGAQARYPTAPAAAIAEFGDPDVAASIAGDGFERFVAASDGGEELTTPTNFIQDIDHAWASSYFGEQANPGNANGFLTDVDTADGFLTIRLIQCSPAVAADSRTWAPHYYDALGAAPGWKFVPDAVFPSPVACAIPIRLPIAPNGEYPRGVWISSILYADAIVGASNSFAGPQHSTWTGLEGAASLVDADTVLAAAPAAAGGTWVCYSDSTAGEKVQLSSLEADRSLGVHAVLLPADQLAAAGFAAFAAHNGKSRAYVAYAPGGPGGLVRTYNVGTGAKVGADLDVGAAEAANGWAATSVITGIAVDEAANLLYVAFCDPGVNARVVAYSLNAATGVPSAPRAANYTGASTLFDAPPGGVVGGRLGVDGSGRLFVSSGDTTGTGVEGVHRLTRTGATLHLDATLDADGAQSYGLLAVGSAGEVTVAVPPGGIITANTTVQPDVVGDNGPECFAACDGAGPAVNTGLIRFSPVGVRVAETRLVVLETGARVPLLSAAPTVIAPAGAAPAATTKALLITDGPASHAELAWVSM